MWYGSKDDWDYINLSRAKHTLPPETFLLGAILAVFATLVFAGLMWGLMEVFT